MLVIVFFHFSDFAISNLMFYQLQIGSHFVKVKKGFVSLQEKEQILIRYLFV